MQYEAENCKYRYAGCPNKNDHHVQPTVNVLLLNVYL